MTATLLLGRDGLGEATEADFASWVAYVSERIDESGVHAAVSGRGPRDVQGDEIVGASDEERVAIEEARRALWDRWCAEGALGPR